MNREAPNHKHQTTNKHEIQMTKRGQRGPFFVIGFLMIGICLVIGAW
jgi:uncharacterized membrane protein